MSLNSMAYEIDSICYYANLSTSREIVYMLESSYDNIISYRVYLLNNTEGNTRSIGPELNLTRTRTGRWDSISDGRFLPTYARSPLSDPSPTKL